MAATIVIIYCRGHKKGMKQIMHKYSFPFHQLKHEHVHLRVQLEYTRYIKLGLYESD